MAEKVEMRNEGVARGPRALLKMEERRHHPRQRRRRQMAHCLGMRAAVCSSLRQIPQLMPGMVVRPVGTTEKMGHLVVSSNQRMVATGTRRDLAWDESS